jgi:CBS domain-containing protein
MRSGDLPLGDGDAAPAAALLVRGRARAMGMPAGWNAPYPDNDGSLRGLPALGTQEGSAMKVRDIMTSTVVACPSSADLAEAAKLMWQGRFGTLPVVDAHGRIVGILTDRDIAMAVATRHRNASHIAVHEAMSHKVHSCFADDEVAAALKQMEVARVRRLPVLDAAGILAGILSVDDIVLRALDADGGVSSVDLASALRRICALPAIEPEANFTETFVSG